ncbi:MAG: putative DNA binding domain-containing protein [Phormidesmis sp. CAN_BIN44]|nr:putative DNA binding domain-containing protein [Phormidesmis sp. CAN_BIN44]
MTPEELYRILALQEGLKLDFKREYKLNSQPPAGVNKQEWKKLVNGQWDELIKDVIALTNGNSGTVGQEAFLVVGVDDKPDSTGIRPLYDTSHIQITRQQIMAKVNDACDPPIPEILCERVELSGKTILVIRIPSSPHLHETKRQLNIVKGSFDSTGKLADLREDKTYTAHTAFIRRGEDIFPATNAERSALQREKEGIQKTVTTIDEDPEIPEDETPPISPSGMEDRVSDVINICEETYPEPIRLIEWHLGEDQQINALFRERRRGWYFNLSLSQNRKGKWSTVNRVCPIFLPLLEPDKRLWHELTCSALPEDWYALDEIIRLGLKFQGSQIRWAGQYAIGENVADDAMEQFGVYVPDEELLPVFLFINKQVGLLLVSYFKNPDGFAKENLLRDDNTNECCVIESLLEAQQTLEEKFQSYTEQEID